MSRDPMPETRMETQQRSHVHWNRQPFKTLYLTFQIPLLALRVLLWTIKFSLTSRSKRPSPSYSVATCVAVNLIRRSIVIGLNAGLLPSKRDLDMKTLPMEQTNKSLPKECELVWIPGVHEDDIIGDIKQWKERNGTSIKDVAVFWWGQKDETGTIAHKAACEEKILVHFHGGGYVLGSAHPQDKFSSVTPIIYKYGTQSSPPAFTRMLAVEYRVSRTEPIATPANAFPAALIDALAAIHYLVFEIGFHPQSIILSGDSAGGNLALAVTRYLRDAPLPGASPWAAPSTLVNSGGDVNSLLPGGLFLQSPWVDPMSTHVPARAGKDCSYVRNAPSDIVGRNPYSEERPYMGMSAYGQRAFLGPNMSRDYASKNAYVAPGSLDIGVHQIDQKGRRLFEGYPPMFISAGGREVLVDEIVYLANVLQDHATTKELLTSSHDGNHTKSNLGTAEFDCIRYKWIELDIEPDMFHVFCSTPQLASAEGKRTMEKAMAWINALPTSSLC